MKIYLFTAFFLFSATTWAQVTDDEFSPSEIQQEIYVSEEEYENEYFAQKQEQQMSESELIEEEVMDLNTYDDQY